MLAFLETVAVKARAFIARYLVHKTNGERKIAYVPVHQLQRDPKATMKEVLRFLFSDKSEKRYAVNFKFDFTRRHHVKRL